MIAAEIFAYIMYEKRNNVAKTSDCYYYYNIGPVSINPDLLAFLIPT